MEQLGLVSAVLGGFAFTFVAALLTLERDRKIVNATFLVALLTASLFFVCALGWSLGSMTNVTFEEASEAFKGKHQFLSYLFLLGIFSLNTCIGMIGWARSKRLGILTTVLGVFGIWTILYVLSGFIV